MPTIQLGAHEVAYTIRRSNRAKYLNLRIHSLEGLEVVIPNQHSYTHAEIETVLRERGEWILKHLHRYEAKAKQMANPERLYVDGSKVSYLGEPQVLRITQSPNAKNHKVTLLPTGVLQIELLGQALPNEAEQSALVYAVLEAWYRIQAKAYISERTEVLAAQHGFSYGRISIKNQKTRWGSCSSKGNLNFNWRLMLAPAEGVDYIIVHELCHLRELNHSACFWALVAGYCPDYQYWRRWFKENGAALYL